MVYPCTKDKRKCRLNRRSNVGCCCMITWDQWSLSSFKCTIREKKVAFPRKKETQARSFHVILISYAVVDSNSYLDASCSQLLLFPIIITHHQCIHVKLYSMLAIASISSIWPEWNRKRENKVFRVAVIVRLAVFVLRRFPLSDVSEWLTFVYIPLEWGTRSRKYA